MGRTSGFHWPGRVSGFTPMAHALALGGLRAEERGGRREGGMSGEREREGRGCEVGGEGRWAQPRRWDVRLGGGEAGAPLAQPGSQPP